jgi:hypothetical protein
MQRLQHQAACLRTASSGSRTGAAPAPVAAAEDTRTPVCLVIGAGAGIGQGVARRFAKEGMHACVVRRGGGPSSLSDDKTPQLFEEFVQSIKDDGGQATAFFACVRCQPESDLAALPSVAFSRLSKACGLRKQQRHRAGGDCRADRNHRA